MRFLTKIRERQFAKKWGGAYNLSRAVLAGVLAAGCLMPGFAEAAELHDSSGVNWHPVGNIATITGDISGAGDREIYWKPDDVGASVEGYKINVNNVNSTNISINIYGGYSIHGTANENSVIISNGEFNNVRVDFDANTADKNSVIINGGTFNGSVQGGNGLNAYGNSVIISDGEFNATVSGGDGGNAADGNSVSIGGGTFNGVVSGGYVKYDFDTADKTANDNQVIISGGEFYAPVSGGYVKYDGPDTNNNTANTTANGNQVIISGDSFIDSEVAGGVAESGSYTAINTAINTAKNNKVILVGNHAIYKFIDTQGAEHTLNGGNIEITGTVYGGITNSDSGDASGNEIHVYGSNINVGNIDGFDKLQFFIDDRMNFGKTMLTINGMSDLVAIQTNDYDTDYPIVSIPNYKLAVTVSGKPNPSVDNNTDNTITLVDYPNGTIGDFENGGPVDVKIGATLSGNGRVALTDDEKKLVLTLNVEKSTVNENGKSLVETRAAAAFVVNNMSDFMLGTGMEQAKAAAGGVTPIDEGKLTPFAAVGGSNMRYTTGSYVDVNGWNGAVGFAKQADKLLFGVAVEHGRGNYDSYLDNGVHASGDIKSTGGVIFGEYKLDNGVHYDAALRAGRVKSDYSSTATSYDESSTYYGFSLGGGKELTVSDKATLDVYGRYYFSHTNGSDVSIATGEEIDFDAVNSHRLRIGGRYTTTLTEKSKAYAGLAWQYEFGGDAKAAINGYSAPTPSLQGHSAIVEAGYKLNAGKNLTLDFNLNGAMGKQRGIGGGIGAQWLF